MTVFTIDQIEQHYENKKQHLIILSPEFEPVYNIFTPNAHGRLILIFTHPVERELYNYHYLKSQQIIPSSMTIDEYVSSDYIDNIIVRSVTNKFDNKNVLSIDDDDLTIVKNMFRRKCLVGLNDNKTLEDSLLRIDKLFQRHLHLSNIDSIGIMREGCLKEYVHKYRMEYDIVMRQYPTRGSREWELLESKNKFDMIIYEYVKYLFQEEALIHYKGQRQHPKQINP